MYLSAAYIAAYIAHPHYPYIESLLTTDMWQSWIEIEYCFDMYFKCITDFE